MLVTWKKPVPQEIQVLQVIFTGFTGYTGFTGFTGALQVYRFYRRCGKPEFFKFMSYPHYLYIKLMHFVPK